MILGLHGKRHAGSRSLRVVDEHVDAAEGIVDLLHRVLDDLFGFLIRVDVRHDGQHLDAVETLQLLLGVEQLLLVAAGDGQVRAFLGISRRREVHHPVALDKLPADDIERVELPLRERFVFCQNVRKSHINSFVQAR